MNSWLPLWLLSCTLLFSCKKDVLDSPAKQVYTFNLPPGVDPPLIPPQNPLTLDKIALGKLLFFDPILSKDSTISCASCHVQSNAFADPNRLSKGVEDSLGFRNAISLTNTAYANLFFRDGGVPSLELQVIAPIESPFEMQNTLDTVIKRLQRHDHYKLQFQEVFGSEVTKENFTQAIAAFERTMISFNSPFDRHYYYNEDVLSESEKNGMTLFFSDRLACSSCHSLPNFTNQGFANNGLYEDYEDMGRRRVTVSFNDDALFKIPTLRNIARTAPYMHDGSIPDLLSVFEHYNSGGSGHFNKSDIIKPLGLTMAEKIDLLNFLNALTDETFLNDPTFRP